MIITDTFSIGISFVAQRCDHLTLFSAQASSDLTFETSDIVVRIYHRILLPVFLEEILLFIKADLVRHIFDMQVQVLTKWI
tara:strand:- start:7 stop:249 length:243 start_codon:yes stop_codon:yes gene_type:complete